MSFVDILGFTVLINLSNSIFIYYHVQFSSLSQVYLTLCDPMDCSTPGFHVHHQLSELLKLMSIKSVMPSNHFFLFLKSFPAAGFFPVNQFFSWGGQSIRVSASASVLSMNIQDWFPLGWTRWIMQSKELSRVFSNTIVQKHQFFGIQLSL